MSIAQSVYCSADLCPTCGVGLDDVGVCPLASSHQFVPEGYAIGIRRGRSRPQDRSEAEPVEARAGGIAQSVYCSADLCPTCGSVLNQHPRVCPFKGLPGHEDMPPVAGMSEFSEQAAIVPIPGGGFLRVGIRSKGRPLD